MERFPIDPRANWEEKAKEVGFLHHTSNGVPYWAEDRYYTFTPEEIDRIEAATNELHSMCLEAVGSIIAEQRFSEFAIPEFAVPLIVNSWERDDPSIYGRFDLAFNPYGVPKLLEYNADTPTSLVEASIAQWYWLQDKFPHADQFNSIHEKLVGYWAHLRPYLKGDVLHFASLPDAEDICTVNYLRDTANQANIRTTHLTMDQISWWHESRKFIEEPLDEHTPFKQISSIFKLYPWEWMVHEAFNSHIPEADDTTQWIEPAWKMLLSNKAILPVLWELYPDHPNLLPAYKEQYLLDPGSEYVIKPLLSREGANITIVSEWEEHHAETGGEYGEEGFIYQQYAPLPEFDGYHPVVGSWVIGGEAAGIGIREDTSRITGNMSRFVPHLIRE